MECMREEYEYEGKIEGMREGYEGMRKSIRKIELGGTDQRLVPNDLLVPTSCEHVRRCECKFKAAEHKSC